MDEEILSKYATKSSINTIPYSNFFVAQKRKILEEEYARGDNLGHVNKRAKVSLYENFESLKKQRLSENDVCIDHFKDMDKYISQVKELRSIYNFLFSDHLTNEHDILHVSRKFCSIQCNDIIDRNICFESSTERCTNGLYSYAKSGANASSDALIRKKGVGEMEAHVVPLGENNTDWGRGNGAVNPQSGKNNHLINGDNSIDNYHIAGEEQLGGPPRGSSRIPAFGKRILNSVSNQILYIDDLSTYDILLLVSLVTQLQNEQKENEKEEKNLEVLANIDEFQVNAHSLKEIFRSYFKEKTFQCFTCGLRFSSSLEKLNHLENHYQKNKYYTSVGAEKPGANRNRKKIIFLDHMSMSIEFFICKEYSIFEDVYENVVTKNCNSFNYNAKWEADRKTVHVEGKYEVRDYQVRNYQVRNYEEGKYELRNYEGVSDSARLKSAGRENHEANFASRVIDLTDEGEPGDVENALGEYTGEYAPGEYTGERAPGGDPNWGDHARKTNNPAQRKREPPPETLAFYISSGGPELKEAEDAPFDKSVQDVFHFGTKSNEMDNFFWAKRNDAQNGKNEKKKKKLRNVEDDDHGSSSDSDNNGGGRRSGNRNSGGGNDGEINFFDFIYGNQNTYDVNLSNYYTVTEDNNVHISYIDGEVMFKNILQCLEIKDISSYVFPSWIPRRSIQNFLVRPVTEMYGQQVTSSNSFANIAAAKGMGNLFMNKYAQEDAACGNKLAVQSNVWNLCTRGEFYLTKQLVPINVFFSLSKGGEMAKRGEATKRGETTKGGAPLQEVGKRVSDEWGEEPSEGKSNRINRPSNEIDTSKGAMEGGKLQRLGNVDYSTDDLAEETIMRSFLHIFDEKYFQRTSVFKETFLFYLRSNYFEMSHHLSDDANFNNIEERLYSYIQNNYTQKMAILDTNNYQANECFLCKEKFLFDYSYEYNDFYYTDAVAVDLNNLLEDEEDQAHTYSFNFSAKRIDQLSDRCIYNDPSYDILDSGIGEAEMLFQKMQNGDAHVCNGVSQSEEEKNDTATESATATANATDGHIGERHQTAHSSVHMNDLLENVKKIIGENCVLKRTVIESALKHNCQMKNMKGKKKKKKDDHMQHYNNLFKNFCIPHETVSILHDIQKENKNRSSANVNDVSQFDINHEYANDEIDDFVNYFENVTQQVTNSLFENIYKGNKMDKHIFTHMTNCYINDDNEKKDTFTNIYFPSKNYLHTNFTYFHHQCFKNYVHYFIFPYYFLTKLDHHLFKKIVISAVRQFFKAYHRICKFGTSEVKHVGGTRPSARRRPTRKAGQLQVRRHF